MQANTCKELLDFCVTPNDRLHVIQVYIQILHSMREWTELTSLLEEMHTLRNILKLDTDPHDDLELVQLDAGWQLCRNWSQIIVAR